MARQFRVLALDDDPAMGILFSLAFRDLPVELAFTTRPDEAESLLKEQSFHLFLIDFQLDDNSGIDIAKRFLTQADRAIPIVVVSAQPAESLRSYVEGGQCIAHKTKPIMLATFGKEIVRYLTSALEEPAAGVEHPNEPNLGTEYLRTAMAVAHRFRLSSDLELLSGSTLAQAAHKWVGISGIDCLPHIEYEARRLERLALAGDAQSVPEIRDLLFKLTAKLESAALLGSKQAESNVSTSQGECLL